MHTLLHIIDPVGPWAQLLALAAVLGIECLLLLDATTWPAVGSALLLIGSTGAYVGVITFPVGGHEALTGGYMLAAGIALAVMTIGSLAAAMILRFASLSVVWLVLAGSYLAVLAPSTHWASRLIAGAGLLVGLVLLPFDIRRVRRRRRNLRVRSSLIQELSS